MAECLQVGEQLATGRSGKGGRQETQSKKQQLLNDFIVKKKNKMIPLTSQWQGSELSKFVT